ncbi:unnamed protein product [Caenorhabditis sp. 36 PRJEB53466]|nr:unnamed protein product [Caenorhabditis sp. 36 PRJEB53466]
MRELLEKRRSREVSRLLVPENEKSRDFSLPRLPENEKSRYFSLPRLLGNEKSRDFSFLSSLGVENEASCEREMPRPVNELSRLLVPRNEKYRDFSFPRSLGSEKSRDFSFPGSLASEKYRDFSFSGTRSLETSRSREREVFTLLGKALPGKYSHHFFRQFSGIQSRELTLPADVDSFETKMSSSSSTCDTVRNGGKVGDFESFERKTIDEENNIEVRRSTPVMICLNATIIGLVALTWCLSTQFSKTALNFDTTNFNAPYFMMWFNTNLMLLCFPVYILVDWLRTRRSVRVIVSETASTFGKNKGLSVRNLFVYVAPFVVFWVGANYPYVRALLLITPSVATSISACNAAFVYILAIFLLGDTVNVFKILSVILAIGGVVVISLDHEMRIEWLGILFAFLSAFMAAVYKVSFKRIIGNASLGDVSLFMSCLGFLNLIINWIPPLVLALTGVETLRFAYAPWWPMVGAALLSMAFNFTINFGIALLNPLVISVGMLCGIPLNTVIDILFRGLEVTTLFLIGTCLIILSFILIIIPYDKLGLNGKCDNARCKATQNDASEFCEKL